MSDIDISEPLSDLLAPLNNEQREFLMNNYTIQTVSYTHLTLPTILLV